MLVFPLGLGTRLRRWPFITVAIALAWLAVAAVDDSSDRIMERLMTSVARSNVRDASRTVFEQYCRERKGDPDRCKRYAILVWTGFPGRKGMAVSDEHERAKELRKELKSCGSSRRCYAYKDTVWRFLEGHRTDPAKFKHLRGYAAYRKATAAYRKSLRKICKDEHCLVRGNVNWLSLAASQVRHGGWLHVLGNLLAFVIFGMYVEQRTSRLTYLGATLAGGTLGMAVHTIVFGSADAFALGGSANVSTVMGMFFVFYYHQRMRFQVWIPRKLYLGTPFFADVKYCFPLLFVLSDISGGFDTGFTSLVATRVAHFAHLSGLLTGVLVGLLVVTIRRLPRPFIYEQEVKDMLQLEQNNDMGQILLGARRMIGYNPENVHAMEVGCGAFLRWAQVARANEHPALYERGRLFVIDYMQAVCAINARKGEMRYACKLLSQMPLFMPYRIYLDQLGQTSAIRLGDYALSEGHPLLALRLYDFYLSRFPLSVKGPNVEATIAGILAGLTPTADMRGALTTFITYHPTSLVAPRIGAWLANAPTRVA